MSRPSPLSRAALAILFLALGSMPALAQQRPVEETEEAGGRSVTDEEQRYDALVQRFQKDYLRFTTLVQVVPVARFEERDGNQPGFDLAAAWLGIGGRLDGGIGYFVRGAFERSPTVLEAYVSYGSDDVRGLVGKQKVPLSAEFLTGAANIDFVNRARIVRQVVPGRSIGAQLVAAPGDGPLSVRAGVFNATYLRDERGGFVTQSERGGLLLAGRVQADVPAGDGSVVLGANASYDTEDFAEDLDAPARLVIGADARARLGPLLVAGELLHRSIDSDFVPEPSETTGGYATLGFDVSPDDRVLARLDVLSASGGDPSNEILLGYNRTFTRAASFQANVIVPLDDGAEPFQALLNFQLSF